MIGDVKEPTLFTTITKSSTYLFKYDWRSCLIEVYYTSEVFNISTRTNAHSRS